MADDPRKQKSGVTAAAPSESDCYLQSTFDRRAADRLAYAVAKCIECGAIGTRSGPADALLAYLKIGGLDGPKSVRDWVRSYESRESR